MLSQQGQPLHLIRAILLHMAVPISVISGHLCAKHLYSEGRYQFDELVCYTWHVSNTSGMGMFMYQLARDVLLKHSFLHRSKQFVREW